MPMEAGQLNRWTSISSRDVRETLAFIAGPSPEWQLVLRQARLPAAQASCRQVRSEKLQARLREGWTFWAALLLALESAWELRLRLCQFRLHQLRLRHLWMTPADLLRRASLLPSPVWTKGLDLSPLATLPPLVFRPLSFPLPLIRLPLLQLTAFLRASVTSLARLLRAAASRLQCFQNFLSSDLYSGPASALALCLPAFSPDRRRLTD